MRDNGKKRGFAAIEGMVTDLEATSRSSRALYIGQPIATWRYAFNGKGWLIISLCVGLLFIPIGDRKSPPLEASQTQSAPAAPAPTAPTQASVSLSPPTPLPMPGPLAAGDKPRDSNAFQSFNAERVPPIGKGFVLDMAQMRYCLSEDIRLTAWQERVNRNSKTAVDSFNSAVNDYNARCGNFSYRTGSLESVRAEVEKHRDMLARQGFDRAARNR
jgi:hypothetical protein